MDTSTAIVWNRARRSWKLFAMTSILPLAGVSLAGTLVAVLQHRVLPGGFVVVLLPLLLQRAELEWQRLQPPAIRLDLRGMWIGDELRILWNDIAHVQPGSVEDRHRRGRADTAAVRVALDHAAESLPRSLVWRLGLHPGESAFDFYLPADFGVPVERIARVLDELRLQSISARSSAVS